VTSTGPFAARGAPLAVAGIVIALALAFALAAVAASPQPGVGTPPADDVKESVRRDCRTFGAYSQAKHARIRDALRRGNEAEAQRVVERLLQEEARTLQRVIWYVGQDRANRATVQALKKELAGTEALSPADSLKKRVASRFAPPAWLGDPYAVKGEDASEKGAGETVASGPSKSGAAATAYGVAGSPVTPAIAPVVAAPAPAAPPPPPPPAPPPPPPPPPGGGGGAGSGGSGGGSHSSQ
jgi:hypothetical protein